VLPPRPVRRITGPLLIGALVVGVVLLPVLLVVAVVASVWLPGRWRAVRLLAFALAYLGVEVAALVAAAVLWVLSGFGRRLHTRAFQAAHYTVLRLVLDGLMRVAQRLFALRVVTDGESWSPLDDGVPGSTNAMVVLSRHAGPGDSFLLVHTLMNRDHLRRPRIVLKDLLQLDPVIDVHLNRLPNHFVSAGPDAGDRSEAAIAELAQDLGEEDALLIFPEGANFTPQRRTRAIQRLRDRGLRSAARRAEAMRSVLPPRPAGVVAALTAAPHADVVFVAHTGLEHLSTMRDLWRGLPMDKTLHLRWWFVPAAQVPREEAQLTDWLYRWWETIDAWITSTSAASPPAGKNRTGAPGVPDAAQALNSADVPMAGTAEPPRAERS
jgi:1-acyl-sn-glycerol-3-phosphate acyltransferase